MMRPGDTVPRVRLRAEERRRQIIEVTLGVVAEFGVQGTTTRRIAAAAGVSEATLYKHFASRNDILKAALDAVYGRIFEVIDQASGPDALARLRQVAAAHQLTLSSDDAGFALPLFEFVAAPPEADLREALGRKQLRAVEAIADIVTQGIDDGVVAADADPGEIAWALISVFWLRDVAHLMGLAEPAAAGSASLLDRILEAIAAPRPAAGA